MKHILFLLILSISLSSFATDTSHITSILEQLHLNERDCPMYLLEYKKLPNKPEQTAYVIPTYSKFYDEDFYILNTYIVLADSETGKITQSHYDTTCQWVHDAIRLVSIQLDMAAYNITPSTRAFGVRVNYRGSSGPNPYEGETLSLFALESDTIVKLLNNYEMVSSGGDWDTKCTGEFMYSTKVLIITNKLTSGHYNLLVKNRITETKTYEDENGECQDKETKTTEKTVLTYKDRLYQEVTED